MPQTRQAFERELVLLRQELLAMGTLVESMLHRSLQALVQQDVALAKQVIRDDDRADDQDLSIEQHCIRLLALQHPLSRDLRTVGTVLKVIADVERMADYGVDIARAAIALDALACDRPLVDLAGMGELVADMLRLALQALVQEDLQLVDEVVARDDQVDDLWKARLEELTEILEQRPQVARPAVQLLLVARYLERIADHVVNVAERVAYLVTGEFTQLTERHKATVVD